MTYGVSRAHVNGNASASGGSAERRGHNETWCVCMCAGTAVNAAISPLISTGVR